MAPTKPIINLNEKIPSDGEEPESPTRTPDSVQPPPPASLTDRRSSPPAADPDSGRPRKEGEEGPAKGTTATVVSSGTGPVNDIYRRIRRAERFGMPVQLSEEEKRYSRAERFGTGSVLNKSGACGGSEDLKRKARAERFGTSVSSLVTDEEAKKKARLAKFGSGSKTDTHEEDKRKARAIRFSNLPSSSLSQVHGKAVIAGKATGGA
ncbi:hypothetical protein BT93_K0400 [Corymbia citriodora subsp. variegata]|nr:hypothetical protein BT93_K0400 [Corymbia citriodora subsp. variegata]